MQTTGSQLRNSLATGPSALAIQAWVEVDGASKPIGPPHTPDHRQREILMRIHEVLHTRTGAVVAGAMVLVTLGGLGTAAAGGLITSADIKDGAVKSVDIADNGVKKVDIADSAVGGDQLTDKVNNKLNTGRVVGLEVDGPYPGVTVLKEGDNSTATWVGDSGATLQSSWVMCAPGKVAIGGGFSHADDATSDLAGIQIVTSRPAQYQGGVEVFESIEGDVDGSIVANAWLVEGFNNNASGELILRPWVVCATIK